MPDKKVKYVNPNWKGVFMQTDPLYVIGAMFLILGALLAKTALNGKG